MSRPRCSNEIPQRANQQARRGIVLLLVLLVVMMLALGGYSFARLMNAEAMAAQHHSHRVRARAAANAGVEYTLAILATQQQSTVPVEDLWDNPRRFRDILVSPPSNFPRVPDFRFSVIAPPDQRFATGQSTFRYGVSDESARLNLNGWPWIVYLLRVPDDLEPPVNPLLSLPGMQPEIADAILDWIDPDDQPRPNGAESDYYLSLSPPYRPRNGPLQSLEELLMVRGVTPRMLYGEDANRNGLLDANENDGRLSYPDDDSDGILDRGWRSYLTLHSRSVDTDRRGRQKIFVNASDLVSLYQALSEDAEIDDELSRFVIAYRLFGPIRDAGDDDPDESDESDESDGEDGRIVDEPGPPNTPAPGLVIAGLDASGGPAFDITSPLDLVDVSVAATLDGNAVELKSPLRSIDSPSDLDHWLDRVMLVERGGMLGRVNVNSASREVLLAIPQMTEEMARGIVEARLRRQSVRRPFDAGLSWLLEDGVLTLEELKPVEPYLTGYSQLYRIQVIGYSGDGKAASRVVAVGDLSGDSPAVLWRRELTSLGRGVDLSQVK